MKNKHLTLENRYKIKEKLNEGNSFKKIGDAIGKHKTTISNEVKKKFTIVNSSNFNNSNNYCKIKQNCIHTNLCNSYYENKCKFCYKCNSVCSDFIPDVCEKLSVAPYVCNLCLSRKGCRKQKHVYKAKEANEQYLFY